MQYSIIQDMQDEFLRVNQRQLQIINAHKGVALEGPFSVVAGAFKAIIDAFKNFIARVVGWFKERFGGSSGGGKVVHTKPKAEVVEKILKDKGGSAEERFFDLLYALPEEEGIAYCKSVVTDEYKARDKTGLDSLYKEDDPNGYYRDYLELELAHKLSMVMTPTLKIAIWSEGATDPAFPQIYKYKELAERLNLYTVHVYQAIGRAGENATSFLVGEVDTLIKSFSGYKVKLGDRSDNTTETDYATQLKNMRERDTAGLTPNMKSDLMNGGVRLHHNLARLSLFYTAYVATADILSKHSLDKDSADFIKKAEKNTELTRLIPIITDAVSTQMAVAEMLRVLADSALATMKAYTSNNILHARDQLGLIGRVLSSDTASKECKELATRAQKAIESDLADSEKYLKELK